MNDKQKTIKSRQILNDVLNLVESGRKRDALDLIGEELDIGKTQRYVWLDKILENADIKSRPEPTSSKDIEFKDKYTYNSKTDQYIFLSNNVLGKNIVLEGSLVKSLIVSYSNYDNNEQTYSELSKKFDIPKKIIKNILGTLGMTHDDFPVLDEELDRDDEDLIDELLTAKKFNLYQEYQRKDWHETQEKARKWDKFIQGHLHPLKDLLATWEPPEVEPLKASSLLSSFDEKESVLIGLSDLHFGLYAEGDGLFFSDKTWTIEDTKAVVQNYAEKIVLKLLKRSHALPKKVVICLMGDLIHTLTGETDKGTTLEAHPIGEKQLDFAIEAVYIFVASLGSIFEEVEVKAVNGNHSYLGDYSIGKALEMGFRKEKRYSFELATSRFLAFTMGNNGFIMDHGASSHTKSKLPTQKGPRSDYGQSVILSNKKVRNSEHRYYLVGDQHHLEHQEYNNFELIMFSSPSGGDRYADSSVFISRPRQSCLIFNEDGLSEILHFYFD